jgi:hypothetical protein
MVSIYASAFLTIVAAGGTHADYGLRGLRLFTEPRACQQDVFELHGGTKVIEVPPPLAAEYLQIPRRSYRVGRGPNGGAR